MSWYSELRICRISCSFLLTIAVLMLVHALARSCRPRTTSVVSFAHSSTASTMTKVLANNELVARIKSDSSLSSSPRLRLLLLCSFSSQRLENPYCLGIRLKVYYRYLNGGGLRALVAYQFDIVLPFLGFVSLGAPSASYARERLFYLGQILLFCSPFLAYVLIRSYGRPTIRLLFGIVFSRGRRLPIFHYKCRL